MSRYMGPVRAVIFDWAGTIVDYGSCAPAEAFCEVFKRAGVSIDVATARGPMGKNKRDHISEIIYAPHVSTLWRTVHGQAPTEADIDKVYAAFTPVQVEVVKRRSAPIPGALATIAALRAQGIKIGSCSGYNTEIMAAVLEGAVTHGLKVDAMECANATNGRPKPWMSTRVAETLDAFPLYACVKVDDTLPGIEEGINAGMWTVGVARSGNEMGLNEEEEAALLAQKPEEHKVRLGKAKDRFAQVGANFVIDSVAELLPVIEKINALVKQGKTPFSQ